MKPFTGTDPRDSAAYDLPCLLNSLANPGFWWNRDANKESETSNNLCSTTAKDNKMFTHVINLVPKYNFNTLMKYQEMRNII